MRLSDKTMDKTKSVTLNWCEYGEGKTVYNFPNCETVPIGGLFCKWNFAVIAGSIAD